MSNEPTKQRAGDQVLPTGDMALEDDQALLIIDIEERRQVGIERYGQGHRPFNGRDTLHDLYEEQLDLLVYLRSIKRMSEATRGELVRQVCADFEKEGFQHIAANALAQIAVNRIMGYVDSKILEPDARAATWDQCVQELFDLGWLHDWAKSDALGRNPHRQEKVDG